jgi:acetyl-CoA carboxylase biotin carboxylase subunit
VRRGAAIECRIYAEDPRAGFLPSPGRIDGLKAPSGPFVRDDSGVYPGAEVSSHYDPLISKLSVWGPDRAQALGRMRRALREYVVTGIQTNLRFHERLLQHPVFAAGEYDTSFVDTHRAALIGDTTRPDDGDELAVALAVAVARQEKRSSQRQVDGTASLPPWVAAHRLRLLS